MMANTKITRANVGTDDIGKLCGSAMSMRGGNAGQR